MKLDTVISTLATNYIREIANMARANVEQRNNLRRANANDAERSFNIDDNDIREMIRLVRNNNNNRIPDNVFNVERVRLHRRFNYNEYIYNVTIGGNNHSMLPDF